MDINGNNTNYVDLGNVMIEKRSLLQQASSEEEKILLARLYELAKGACGSWKPSGFFLDPGKCRKIGRWFGDCEPVLWGGFQNAERCMVSFGDREADEGWFPIAAVRMVPAASWDVSHRDVLGALMNLGVDRSKMGDILVSEQAAVVFCDDSLADFFVCELRTVGRYAVKTEEVSIDSVEIPEKKFRMVTDTVASLRADCVVASVYAISRGKAQEAIRSGRVTVNWEEIVSANAEMAEGDIISLRGLGRAELTEIGGFSRKGRRYIKAKRLL